MLTEADLLVEYFRSIDENRDSRMQANEDAFLLKLPADLRMNLERQIPKDDSHCMKSLGERVRHVREAMIATLPACYTTVAYTQGTRCARQCHWHAFYKARWRNVCCTLCTGDSPWQATVWSMLADTCALVLMETYGNLSALAAFSVRVFRFRKFRRDRQATDRSGYR